MPVTDRGRAETVGRETVARVPIPAANPKVDIIAKFGKDPEHKIEEQSDLKNFLRQLLMS